ncbi:MAG: DNA polymerase III subunit delta [Dehalococcoidia bacterium]|nr:DNA polymerase III subunit delta [Dehalococcoidia bacterium]
MPQKPIIILYGPDAFTRHEKLQEIRQQLGPSDLMNGNITELDGRQLKLAELRDVCSALPFFGGKRLVIVHDLLKRFETSRTGPGQPFKKQKVPVELEEWNGLASYAGEMPATTMLVLVDDEIKSDNPLLRALAPVADVRTFPLPKAERVRSWVASRVKSAGGSISADAVALIESLVGSDLWAISNEVDKLLSYCAGRTITADDVRLMVSHSREENVFALADAILEGRSAQAQQSFARLVKEGTEPLMVLAMVARQLRLTVRAKAVGHSVPLPELAEKLNLTEWQARKTADMARRFTLDRLKQVYRKLLEADLAIKTSRFHPEDLAVMCLISELGTENVRQ